MKLGPVLKKGMRYVVDDLLSSGVNLVIASKNGLLCIMSNSENDTMRFDELLYSEFNDNSTQAL